MRVTWVSTNDKNGGGPWQSGWKEHAVPLNDGEDETYMSFDMLGKRSALCGLRPRHGWGIDLFIDARCKRCESKATIYGLPKVRFRPFGERKR